MTDDQEDARRWLEPADLLKLVRRDVLVESDESPEAVILREPNLLIPISAPASPPLDLHTYRVRRDRWEAGEGPRLRGIRELVEYLERCDEPARAAVIYGEQTSYTFVLNQDMTRVLAAVAVDSR